jgi:hypothetical protein
MSIVNFKMTSEPSVEALKNAAEFLNKLSCNLFNGQYYSLNYVIWFELLFKTMSKAIWKRK